MSLSIRPHSECKYDLISLGEIMLRLDPGEGRISTAREFKAWEGGGEYNVARGLRRCFGLTTGVATAFADNEIGRLIEDFILQGGVDTSLIKWAPYDALDEPTGNPTDDQHGAWPQNLRLCYSVRRFFGSRTGS